MLSASRVDAPAVFAAHVAEEVFRRHALAALPPTSRASRTTALESRVRLALSRLLEVRMDLFAFDPAMTARDEVATQAVRA
jgi:hypothetical protein